MNQFLQMATMNKQQLRDLLSHQTHRFESIYGGEVVLHAPKDPNPKRLCDKKHGFKPTNLKDAEYKKFLQEVEAGTYRPESLEPAQKRASSKRNVRLDDMRF